MNLPQVLSTTSRAQSKLEETKQQNKTSSRHWQGSTTSNHNCVSPRMPEMRGLGVGISPWQMSPPSRRLSCCSGCAQAKGILTPGHSYRDGSVPFAWAPQPSTEEPQAPGTPLRAGPSWAGSGQSCWVCLCKTLNHQPRAAERPHK